MGVYFMHYFSKVLKTDDDLMSRTTLLIRQMPPVKDHEDSKVLLQEYFQQHFPQVTVTGIQQIYNYHQLQECENEYVNIMNAKKFCEHLNSQSNGMQVTLRPFTFGRLGCCCFCCCKKEDAVEFYNKQRLSLNNNINTEVEKMTGLVPGAAFVSFEREKMTAE